MQINKYHVYFIHRAHDALKGFITKNGIIWIISDIRFFKKREHFIIKMVAGKYKIPK